MFSFFLFPQRVGFSLTMTANDEYVKSQEKVCSAYRELKPGGTVPFIHELPRRRVLGNPYAAGRIANDIDWNKKYRLLNVFSELKGILAM